MLNVLCLSKRMLLMVVDAVAVDAAEVGAAVSDALAGGDGDAAAAFIRSCMQQQKPNIDIYVFPPSLVTQSDCK